MAVRKQGYKGKEAGLKIQEYMGNQQKGLYLRGNYFLGVIKSIIRQQEQIVSLKEEDFNLLETSVQFCLRRLGYAKI